MVLQSHGIGRVMEILSVHHEGVVLDINCLCSDKILLQASDNYAFDTRRTWLIIDKDEMNYTKIEDIMADVLILPNSNIVWASDNTLVDIYKPKVKTSLRFTALNASSGSSVHELEAMWRSLPSVVSRRKDLYNVTLPAATVITRPQYFFGWNDVTVRHIDIYPKLTFPLMETLAQDLNYRVNLRQADSYGVETNGTFDGLSGQLQRREIEFGALSMFMRADRWKVVDYVSDTLVLRGCFIFRQPAQAVVSNMFALPFSEGVWVATLAIFLATCALLTFLSWRMARYDPTLHQLTPAETMTYMIGTLCQQGTYLTPNLISARVVMQFTLITSLFLFTSYSAKIVAILQSPSNSIRTIQDLTHSPMTLGIQETSYKKVYFAESNDPATMYLYKMKLLPQGEKVYHSVQEGISRVRSGLFAFQVERSPGYDMISKTFTEEEKCDLNEIESYRLPMIAVPTKKHSGYKELFATRLRWQREIGILDRTRRIWLAQKPRCDSRASFVRVGIIECRVALYILLTGIIFSMLVWLIEVLWVTKW